MAAGGARRWPAGHRASARSLVPQRGSLLPRRPGPLPDGDPQARDVPAADRQPTAPPGSCSTRRRARRHPLGRRDPVGLAACARPDATAPADRVIVMGGFDGWREEYHVGASYLRRPRHGRAPRRRARAGRDPAVRRPACWTTTSPTPSPRSSTTSLADPRLSDRVGIWGNSMGGFLAAQPPPADPRVAACCVNGGTSAARRDPRAFPAVGHQDPAAARHRRPGRGHRGDARASYLTTDDLARSCTCPLLVLHGTPDQVFLVENARALFDGGRQHGQDLA